MAGAKKKGPVKRMRGGGMTVKKMKKGAHVKKKKK
tara:strand:+ start:1000 stop:1104 length:105 start_codon:yes stop_codon:yes gene_type:complete